MSENDEEKMFTKPKKKGPMRAYPIYPIIQVKSKPFVQMYFKNTYDRYLGP